MRIDLGRLTKDETAELLSECISLLPLDAVIAVLMKLNKTDREEIAAWLEGESS